MNKILLEIAAFTPASAVIAQHAGADRIELCDNPAEGGTTPSYASIKYAREKLSIDLFPIIRPRGGDFLYTDEEFLMMYEDIKICRQLSCDGVVIGLLNKDGSVDTDRTSRLVELAYPMEVTFHRAFDRSRDPFEALEDVIRSGCTRILTSGQKPTAEEGASLICSLIKKADERIIIMPGAGIRDNNIKELVKLTAAKEYHTAARKDIPSLMSYHNSDMKEKTSVTGVDELMIQNIISILRN